MDVEKKSFVFSKNTFIQNDEKIEGPSADFFYSGMEKLKPLSQWAAASRQKLKNQIENRKTHTLGPAFSPALNMNFESFLEKSKKFVFWIQENQKQDFQINYIENNTLKEPLLIENFIILEKKSWLNFFEVADVSESTPLWVVNYIYIGSQAQCHRMHINQKKLLSYVFCSLHQDACFFDLDLNTDSSTTHLEITGEDSDSLSIVQGLNILKNRQKSFQKIINTHQAEGGVSRQFYRSLLGGRSKNTMHSKAVIQAQNTDSHQMIQNLILGPYAHANNKPELEVRKDCVKAAHGASTGQPNPLEIFYLNSRGIPTDQALKFLVKGWVNQVFQTQNIEDLGSKAQSIVEFLKNTKPQITNFLDQKINDLLSDPQNHILPKKVL